MQGGQRVLNEERLLRVREDVLSEFVDQPKLAEGTEPKTATQGSPTNAQTLDLTVASQLSKIIFRNRLTYSC